MGGSILVLVLLLGVILTIVFAVSRSMRKGEADSGTDIIPYLVLALAMGVSGFALASLARTAFPGDRFIFDPAEEVSAAVAALVVSMPFVIYFWKRQATRRARYPHSAGWTVYLTLMELVFTTAFVVSAVLTVDGWIGGGRGTSWPTMIVFGAIVVFHEIAAQRSPTGADSGELPRVVGSAVGLVALWVGASGALTALLGTLFPFGDFDYHPWVSMALVGGVVWGYNWLRAWAEQTSAVRLVWATFVAILSMALVLGSATALLAMTLQYLFTTTPPAGQHFEPSTVAMGLLIVALPVWAIHRRVLGPTATAPHQFYLYAVAAGGLTFGVGGAIALTIMSFDNSLLVGGSSADIITAATIAVVGVPLVWLGFTRQARLAGGDTAASWPRRLYLLGAGIVFGLAAAGGLIAALVILLQRLLDGEEVGGVLTPVVIFLYTGLVAWYLLASYFKERAETGTDTVAAEPFDVTVITSHPGMLAARFPDNARVKVIHRADETGGVDDAMADEIVAAVDGHSSVVWVDDDGFRVAPQRQGT